MLTVTMTESDVNQFSERKKYNGQETQDPGFSKNCLNPLNILNLPVIVTAVGKIV